MELLVPDDSLLCITISKNIVRRAIPGIFYPGLVQPFSDLFMSNGASLCNIIINTSALLIRYMAANTQISNISIEKSTMSVLSCHLKTNERLSNSLCLLSFLRNTIEVTN